MSITCLHYNLFILSLLHTCLPQYYISISILFYHVIFYFKYTIFYSYILNFCTILYLMSLTHLLLMLFSVYIFLSIAGGSLRFKNFIANDCFYVTAVHMTIKILNLVESHKNPVFVLHHAKQTTVLLLSHHQHTHTRISIIVCLVSAVRDVR